MQGLELGQQVDQFRIVRLLGRGGMSEVYLARDIMLGRKVALKLIRPDSMGSSGRMRDFLREARLTAKFAHPHIIAIYSVGKILGQPYLALEYLEGQTLDERMREGAMSVPEVIRHGLAIAQALAEAHSHGVLHRDLKPANVIIAQDGRLRVLDFGLSRIADEFVPPLGSTPDSLAKEKEQDAPATTPLGRIDPPAFEQWLRQTVTNSTNEIQGTPAYMAPERWLGATVSSAADIWALGAILYEMLSEVHPFLSVEQNINDLAKKIVSALAPPPFPQSVTLPTELSQLITLMLDSDPSRRPTGQHVVNVLEGLLQRRRAQPIEKENPFRGLLPFSERHTDLFFGRNTEIEMAVERLRNEPILPVVGPSGAGKSSFVAAGLIPRLRELDCWLVVTVRPGTKPFEALATAIQAGSMGEERNTISPSNSIFNKFLEDESVPQVTEAKTLTKAGDEQDTVSSEIDDPTDSPVEILSRELLESPAKLLLELQALADETEGNVLLFVDQLEELYTLDHDTVVRRAYMEAISRAADDPDGPIRVVFTLRDDFLGRVADTTSAREVLSHISVLRAPGKEALREIVTKPVKLAGYSYEDERMPEEMITAVQKAPASLPILQFACNQLWNRRDSERKLLTRAAYEEMGGVEGALACKADELLSGLSKDQRNMVRQLLLRLVTPDGTRRVISAKELLDGLDSYAAHVLYRLTASRMVVSRRSSSIDDAEAEFELVHDSLIHSWTPLVRWLEQSREEVVFLDEVSRAAELWVSRGRPAEEVWSGRALDESLAKIERCEAVPNRVTEFLAAGERQRQARARRRGTMIFAGFVALLAVIAVLVLMNQETEIQRGLAVTERNRERHARANALREGARAAYLKGDHLEARSKLRASLEAWDTSQARALWWLLEKEPMFWSESIGGFSNRVVVSPDNRMIVVGSGRGLIHIYDTKTLEQRVLRGHKGQVFALAFSPDGRWLSSGASDSDVRLWNLRENSVKVLTGHTNGVWTTAFSPAGKLLVSGSRDHTIRVWDVESGTTLQTIKNEGVVSRVHYTSDGRYLISLNQDRKLRFWNTQSYELEHVIEEPGLHISDVVTSPDGKLLVYGGSKGILVIRDLKNQQELRRIERDRGHIASLSFSPAGDFIAAAEDDGIMRVWDTRNGSLRYQYRHSDVAMNCVAVFPDGERIVSAGGDGTLKLWKLGVDSLQEEGGGHDGPIYGIAFSPDGKTITSGGFDGDLLFWDVKSGHSLYRIHAHDTRIESVEFQPSGKLLASSAFDGSIKLWKLPDHTLFATLPGHRSNVTRVLFSPDEKLIISSSNDKTIAFWDIESLTKIKSISTEYAVNSIDIDRDGRLLASVGFERSEVRDFETGTVLKVFSAHHDETIGVALSHDGKSLYTAGRDQTVRQYILDGTSTDGQIVARHHGAIYWIDVMASTEEVLGTPSADRTAKIWKLETGDIITLKGHQNEVNTIRFSPDGTSAATVSDDGTVRHWDTKTGRPLWHAPLMREDPPTLFTQQGWIGFDADANVSPLTQQWEKALHTRGKIASISADEETLCLATFADELEIWNIAEDERSRTLKHAGIDKVLALPNGCLWRIDGTLNLTTASGQHRILGSEVSALSRRQDFLLVLQDEKALILDLEGNQLDQFAASPGASSLSIVGENVVIGFADGSIEVWQRDSSRSEKILAFREVEASPVTRIIPGPPGTIIAGYGNGSVGIWSLDTGERLYSHLLHGPVIHLLHQDQTMWAATEFGSRLQLDLTMFYLDYCELMQRVWNIVPWVWEEGRPQFRQRPGNHACLQNE